MDADFRKDKSFRETGEVQNRYLCRRGFVGFRHGSEDPWTLGRMVDENKKKKKKNRERGREHESEVPSCAVRGR